MIWNCLVLKQIESTTTHPTPNRLKISEFSSSSSCAARQGRLVQNCHVMFKEWKNKGTPVLNCRRLKSVITGSSSSQDRFGFSKNLSGFLGVCTIMHDLRLDYCVAKKSYCARVLRTYLLHACAQAFSDSDVLQSARSSSPTWQVIQSLYIAN